MNVRGIKLDFSLIQKFISYKIDDLDEEDIKGIPAFEEYNWEEFRMEEFKSFISAIHVLVESEVFSKISSQQEFVFFYKTDVAEMDIVTILEYRKKMVFIDIEVKNEPNAKGKLTKQINKRIKDHFPQIIPNMKYIVIGICNGFFQTARTNLSGSNKIIKCLGNLTELFVKLNNSNSVRNCLIQANNLASVHSAFKAIENKTFKYYEETEAFFEYVKRRLSSDTDVILCFSKAGTGKSFAALKLFFELENTALLLMNIKFYNSLKLNKYFFNDKCTWKPEVFMTYNFDNKIAIIDECQRLSEEQITDIAIKAKKAVFFGDFDQSFMPNDLLCGKSKIISLIENNGLKVREKPLKQVKRFSESASKVIDYLIDYSKNTENPELHGFDINLYYDEDRFIKKYNECNGIKKIFTTYNHKDDGIISIFKTRFRHAEWNYDDFSIDVMNTYVIGNTLHAISFDVEHCFVYLPDLKIKKENGKVYFINNSTGDDKEKIRKLHNELVILFSRAQISLNICVNDLQAFLILNERYLRCIN